VLGRSCAALASIGGLRIWSRFARQAPLALAVADLGREAVKRAVSNARQPVKR
jgi:hypothetical protein